MNNINKETKIELTISQLQEMLTEQKQVVGEYITRNLSVYMWFGEFTGDITKAKEELKQQVMKSGYPNDFNVLNKYIKP